VRIMTGLAVENREEKTVMIPLGRLLCNCLLGNVRDLPQGTPDRD